MYQEYLTWVPKSITITFCGLFGSLGLVFRVPHISGFYFWCPNPPPTQKPHILLIMDTPSPNTSIEHWDLEKVMWISLLAGGGLAIVARLKPSAPSNQPKDLLT